MFLTARLFLYNTIYFHRTVRAIDLDLGEAFGPAIGALFGERNPLEDLPAYADLDEYALLHQAARWARGDDVAEQAAPGDGRVTAAVAELWRGILLRRPTWRAVHEIRRDSRAGLSPDQVEDELRAEMGGADRDGRLRFDLAVADARPQNPILPEGQLIVARRDGTLDSAPLESLLERLPAVVVVGRAYRRVGAPG
jgi:HD superfamily phosphohydrolase